MDLYLKMQGGQFSLCRRFNNKERFYAKRKRVSIFTDGSRRRMLKYLRSSVAKYRVLATLTYPVDYDAKSFRKHWRAFIERWRRVYGDNSSNSIFWFVEFTSRGQLHIHFYANHYIEKGWLAVSWASCVGIQADNGRHGRAGTRIESLRDTSAAIKYAAKYAAKQEQKELPDMWQNQGFRWWGVVGCRDVVAAAITVDELEYVAFELCSVVKTVELVSSRVIFDNNGATVWRIESKKDWTVIFKELKRAEKMLRKAEQEKSAILYRERRG